MAAVIRPRALPPEEVGRVAARRQAAARATLAVLLLSGVLAALPADAEDASLSAPPTPIGLEVLDTSRPPAGGNWVVLAASEDASWREQVGDGWRHFQRGQVLMPGSEIETGPDGEVLLAVGGDQVRVAPSTRLMLPGFAGDRQRLRHERGRLRVEVEPLPGRAFEVTTPLLSLGIKGTSFETAVGREQDTVVVLDGEVRCARSVGTSASCSMEGRGCISPRCPAPSPGPSSYPRSARSGCRTTRPGISKAKPAPSCGTSVRLGPALPPRPIERPERRGAPDLLPRAPLDPRSGPTTAPRC